MTIFLLAATLLLLLTLFAVLRPLLASQRGLAAGIALVAILGSAGLYARFGTPDALDPAMLKAPETLQEARVQLERRLAESPGDPDGWRLLGRAYTAEDRLDKAAEAYAEAARLAPEDPDVLTESAESRALASADRRFDPLAVEQLQKALSLNPVHQRARWFLGISQRQAGEPARAAETWAPLLSQIQDDKTLASLLEQVNEARAEAGLPAMERPAVVAESGIRVEVDFAPGFRERAALPAGAQVFVLARAAGGPPMPVAAEKHDAASLPLTVTLSDADNLMGGSKLSDLKDVEVIARLSMSGSADRGEGDVESAPVRVQLPANAPVRLVIGTD